MENERLTTGMIRRSIELEVRKTPKEMNEENRVRVVASTDENYDWGFYREQLLHDEENVDRSAAVSVLFNHDRDQVIGKILSTELEKGRMEADLEIDEEVKGSNGLKILKALKAGYIRGVSIGYEYDRKDCDVYEDEEEVRNVRVNRWRLREISITPTQADLKAEVKRSLPENWWAESAQKGATRMGEENKTPQGSQGTDAANNAVDELATERAAKDKAQKDAADMRVRMELVDLATSHGLSMRSEEFMGKDKAEGVQMILEAKAGEQARSIAAVGVDVNRDAADKADEAAEDGLMAMAGVKNETDMGMRVGSVLDIGRRWMAANGQSNVLEMNRNELASRLLSGPKACRFDRVSGQRDAANVNSGHFTTYLLANVMDKVVQKGFGDFAKRVTYPLWTGERMVSDFKQFKGAALDAGNLVETTENIAFPELTKGEAGYNGTLAMWGATISLTLQALINDDLGEFMRLLGRAGSIAQRTIDKEVYTQLAAATWTSRTTASSALTDDNLAARRTNMSDITGPSNEKMAHVPAFLIVPSGLRKKALEITQVASYLATSAVLTNTDIQPVITPHLTTATTAANSTWYIAADPSVADTVLVAKLNGMSAPVVEEYDAGAVAARKWKVMLPLKVVVPSIYAMWQGTV